MLCCLAFLGRKGILNFQGDARRILPVVQLDL